MRSRFALKPSDPPDAIGLQIHDNHKLEFWWTVIPSLFVILLSIVSVRIWYEIMLEPENGIVVEAIGHQFYFSFRYPQINGEVTDEMHLPLGVPVTLNLTSADVIHGFWVPAMRLKNDTVPGLVTTIKFTPRLPGRYPIICTQFCGVLHSEMDKQVLVIEPKASVRQVVQELAREERARQQRAARSRRSGDLASRRQRRRRQAALRSKVHGLPQARAVQPNARRAGPRGRAARPVASQSRERRSRRRRRTSRRFCRTATPAAWVRCRTRRANGLSQQDIANLVAFLDTLK